SPRRRLVAPYAATPPRPEFWAALDPAQQAALRAAGRPKQYPVRAPLVYQGDESDHVIIIERGWAKVTSSTEDGHAVVLAVRGPHAFGGGDGAGAAPRAGGARRAVHRVAGRASGRVDARDEHLRPASRRLGPPPEGTCDQPGDPAARDAARRAGRAVRAVRAARAGRVDRDRPAAVAGGAGQRSEERRVGKGGTWRGTRRGAGES